MPTSRARLVRRVAVDPAGAHYASAFAVPAVDLPPLTPEDWARGTLEGAPAAMRWFVRAGWLGVLGLRLGPRSSAQHVLGWPVAVSGPDGITLEAHSPLLTARNVVSVDGDALVWATYVHGESRRGRAVWAAAAPLHHLIIPFLLDRAVRRAS
ncbi:DUF2867 domain-containing protein [Streptomyces sp. MOE7]|uniref:DUF2867 domain-containing protein n=1 Tax=Streptomyces sp. MOE7 TaxID=1961713 RepID=UPI000A000C4A|nr:DUF2867 domain-containing protein [Streptomyces sp. MOE7]ARH91465.1 hypothetical protein STRMOE7_15475 [Streptomyces sp. MOE7]